MERFPVEVLYVLGFIAIVLFNYIAQRAARRRRQEQQAAAAQPPPAEPEPMEELWGRTPASPTAAAAVPAAPPARPPRAHPVRALLSDRRELRRAVALMIVLGPCRAQDPPEGR